MLALYLNLSAGARVGEFILQGEFVFEMLF